MNFQHVIASEFHVDKGPSIKYQYPEDLKALENLDFFAELMIPDQIHRRLDDYTLVLLFKNIQTGRYEYTHNSDTCEPEPYFVYTIVNNVEDERVKRGSVIKALAIITKLPYFKHMKPLLMVGLDALYKHETIDVLKELFNAVNSKNFVVSTQPISIVKKLLITSILDLPLSDRIYGNENFRNSVLGILVLNPDLFARKDLSFNSVVSFNKMNIPIKVPLLCLPDTVGDYFNPTDMDLKPNLLNILNSRIATFHNCNHLTVYGASTPPIIVLINAMLTGKRILFLSYDHSAGYIIDHILMTLKLVTGGGILTGFLTNFNVFPIVDVSKVDILKSCGSYLAGTINPFFINQKSMWDVLYDLDKNEWHISSNLQEPEFAKSSIVSEDAKFLSNLQLSIFNYNDDLTTIQLIIRRHINELVRILLSLKNFQNSQNKNSTLLLDGVGYFWHSDATKLVEMSCYQGVFTKFQDLLYQEKVNYSLLLPNLSNELNLMVDLQHHLQKLNTPSKNSLTPSPNINEREIWLNVLKYLVSAKSLETLLLVMYLIPPSTSTSARSSGHGGNVTIFDLNKGMELLLLNLFNEDDDVKMNVVMIMQELKENFLCGWCLEHFLSCHYIYQLAFEEILKRQ